MTLPKKANHLLRKSIFSLEKYSVSKENTYLHRKYDFLFENTNVSKKVNYLLRKYALGGNSLKNSLSPQGGALTVRFWEGKGPGEE